MSRCLLQEIFRVYRPISIPATCSQLTLIFYLNDQHFSPFIRSIIHDRLLLPGEHQCHANRRQFYQQIRPPETPANIQRRHQVQWPAEHLLFSDKLEKHSSRWQDSFVQEARRSLRRLKVERRFSDSNHLEMLSSSVSSILGLWEELLLHRRQHNSALQRKNSSEHHHRPEVILRQGFQLHPRAVLQLFHSKVGGPVVHPRCTQDQAG